MFQTLDLYQSDFHTPYVLATQAFYSAEASALSSGSLSHVVTDAVMNIY